MRQSCLHYRILGKWTNNRILKGKWERLKDITLSQDRSSMFVWENNRNTFWVYMAHKKCQSFVPLKKEIKIVFHLATIQCTNVGKLLYIKTAGKKLITS